MTAERDGGWLGNGPALSGYTGSGGNVREGETVDLWFTEDQLRMIEQAAASRGCTVEEYISVETLRRAREVLGVDPKALALPVG